MSEIWKPRMREVNIKVKMIYNTVILLLITFVLICQIDYEPKNRLFCIRSKVP